MSHVDPVTLEIFRNQFISVAEEMGVALGRTAYSPNIKERRDFSCACFLADGQMIAQAAHIPVHLGAMPASVQAALQSFDAWAPGDLVALNDPYLGGTHLPDITMVSPVFQEADGKASGAPIFFVASRAHHADVGGCSPGSMPLATEIYQEGLIIPPIKLSQAGCINQAVLELILRNVRTPVERRGDLSAQIAAHRVGERRLGEIVNRYGLAETLHYARALLGYAERLTRAAIERIPDGVYTFRDEMDQDGTIQVAVRIDGDHATVDFAGTSPAVTGPLNAVRAIAESATWYVFYCVARALSSATAAVDARLVSAAEEWPSAGPPMNSGTFAPVGVVVPRGCLLDADPPHAVAGGNVETSQRVADAVLGALAQALPDRIPAASQGTMNNIAVGGHDPWHDSAFAYYETVGGGAGGGPLGGGLSGIQVHMTNTRNTPVEALEYAYPMRVRRYALRGGSGGTGRHCGGDGLVREIEFLSPARVTLLSERRRTRPYGLLGGGPGTTGRNLLVRNGKPEELAGQAEISVEAGDLLSVQTPGGGGWGTPALE